MKLIEVLFGLNGAEKADAVYEQSKRETEELKTLLKEGKRLEEKAFSEVANE